LRALLRGWLDLLLPPGCAGCAEPGDLALCRGCAARLPRIARGRCALCQQAGPAPGAPNCAACAARGSPLDACVAGSWFEGDAADWIRRYKYPPRGLPARAGQDRARLRALIRESLGWRVLAPPLCVVPVPLHRRRLAQRGFNPATLLARELARACGVPLAVSALRRVRETETQTGLGRAARRANVRGAFRARDGVPARIWLVDDVVTTGATLEECARALRRAGAREVAALCAARTPARDYLAGADGAGVTEKGLFVTRSQPAPTFPPAGSA
jgi:ComF family protein